MPTSKTLWHNFRYKFENTSSTMKISVYEILNSQNASLHDDGLALYNEIRRNLDPTKSNDIEVDFSGIKRCSTLFLNASFGKILAEYGEEVVKKFVHPSSYTQILNFSYKFSDMWDNFTNSTNYQAYREEAFA